MKTQNFSNHSRLVAGWHGVTFFAILTFWIGSFVNLAHAEGPALYSASLLSVARSRSDIEKKQDIISHKLRKYNKLACK